MSEPTEAERLEALSHRYVDAARIVALASGRYAVFQMASGGLIAVADASELGQIVQEACRISGEAWSLRKQEELAERSGGPAPAMTKTAADLGL